LISAVGSIDVNIDAYHKYKECQRKTLPNTEVAYSKYRRLTIASICFVIIYLIIAFNHEFVAKLSDVVGATEDEDFSGSFAAFRALSIVAAVLALIGWLCLLSIQDQGKDYIRELPEYQHLTRANTDDEL